METSIFALTIAEHEITGRLVATCDALPGFVAHGRDTAELRARVPNVLRRILERQGKHVDFIDLKPDAPEKPSNIRIKSCDSMTAVAVFDKAA